MAYFRCTTGGSGKGNTLVVTCADDLAGATITCTNGTKTYRKTCPSTAPYEVTFYGLEAGTWTVSATVSGNTYTTTVVVVDCAALLGGFSWRTWVDTASQLDSSDYNSLDEVLADEEAVRELCLEHACVDYMASIATENEDVETIINNDLFAKWVNNSDYALDFLGANVVIKALMDEADKYFYGEWCLMPQVPKMIANTAPYGTAFGNGSYTDNPPYYVFDGNDSTLGSGIASATTSGAFIGYHFVNPVCVKRVSIKVAYAYSTQCIIQASNNGTTYTDLKEFTIVNSDGLVNVDFANENEYSYYRIYQKSTATAHRFGTNSIQFYAYAPKGNVPVMTSDNAPYGTVSASSTNVNDAPYYAFTDRISELKIWQPNNNVSVPQWLCYKFVNPVCVKKIWYMTAENRTTQIKFQASNDNSTWVDLTDTITPAQNGWVGAYLDIDNNNYYLYYRLVVVNILANGPYFRLQFYGRELKVSVPIMTGNTTPYGEAFASSQYSADFAAWQAFTASNSWAPNSMNAGEYVGYDFGKSVKIKMLAITTHSTTVTTNRASISIGGNDGGNTFEEIEVFDNCPTSLGVTYVKNISNPQAFKRFIIKDKVGGTAYWNIDRLQFYGLDYSEKEFEQGTTKKWLYDHGVELETLTQTVGTGGTVVKESDNIYIEANGVLTYVECSSIDLTSYNVMFAKCGKKYLTSTYEGLRVGDSATVPDATLNPITVPKAALSVASFNEQKNVYVVSNSGTSGTKSYYSLAELWLE